MKIKTSFAMIEIEIMLFIIMLTTLLSPTVFRFLYYFFACYLFIFFHELMHIAVGSLLGKNLIKLKLSISGVCATFEKVKEKRKIDKIKNITIYLAGPLSNVILALVFSSSTMIRDINFFLAILNLVPIFPLDGYNVLFNSCQLCFKEKKSKKIVGFVSDILILLLLLIAGFQVYLYMNFSLLIFSVYLFVLKLNSQKKWE